MSGHCGEAELNRIGDKFGSISSMSITPSVWPNFSPTSMKCET